MFELLGLAVISVSILGLIYSIENIFLTYTKSSPQLNSVDNLEAYHYGLTHARQKLTEVSEQ